MRRAAPDGLLLAIAAVLATATQLLASTTAEASPLRVALDPGGPLPRIWSTHLRADPDVRIVPAERAQVMAPEHVAPAVTYLASPQCNESGICINASGGRYARSAIVLTKGVQYDPHEFKDADWFSDNFEKITDMNGAYAPWTFQATREQHNEQLKAAGKGVSRA